MSKIALITASTRTPSVGPSISSWISSILTARPPDTLTLLPLSLASFKLPIYNEPVIPAMLANPPDQFTHSHSKNWSNAIASFAGYIFVIPEYNYGMAGATKNAIDYLFHEWKGKPVVVVSYGAKGGGRANEQLRQCLEGMKVRVLGEEGVRLPFAAGGKDAMSAMREGVLGEESTRLWEESGKREEILRAWEEMRVVIEEEEKEEKKKN